jgi:CBS domain-containing protein
MTKKSKKILVNIPVELKSILKIPITVTPNTGILTARDILLRYKISRLIVESGQKPVGIITEKDIAKNISVFSEKPIGKISVGSIMSKDLVTASLDSSLYDCAKLMKNHGISSIIITNNAKKLVSLVTKTDLVSTFLVQSTASLDVSKIMTKNVVTVSPNDSVFEVESILFNNNISRVVVVKNQQPIGIITYRDFVPAKTFDFSKEFTNPSEREEISQNPQLNEFNVNRLSYLLTFSAKDIMTRNPFIVYSDDVVYTAAILMIRHGISGIPVMKNKKLAGIVTKSDIVNVLAAKGKL